MASNDPDRRRLVRAKRLERIVVWYTELKSPGCVRSPKSCAMSTWRQRNPDAYRAAWRRWYEKNAAKKIAWQTKRRDVLRAWLNDLKSMVACTRCGESTLECLQFHHSDPTEKEIEVAKAVNDGWSKARIIREMEKCEVLCANCHLKHHWAESLKK